MKRSLISILISISGVSLYCQQSDVKSNDYSNAVNVGIMPSPSLFTTINYEHVFNNCNGIVIGLPLIYPKFEDYFHGLSLSYRRHFKPSMKSGFYSIFINYSKYNGSIVTDSGSIINENSRIVPAKENIEYKFINSSLTIGANIGKRWVLQNGIGFTLRIGYGIPFVNIKWANNKPDKNSINVALTGSEIIDGLDGEITIGYSFK